ncbi:MAG: hypothetical protein HYX48_06385 [Chlamydiales bacterium]|nr:hypothetical protein [Chlamydiales bacterium]
MSKVLSCSNDHAIMDHLFVTPFCDDLDLLEKIAIVVFHILTLGIPLAVYHITDCICPAAPAPQLDEQAQLALRLKETVLLSVEQNRERERIRQEALTFARTELSKYPTLKPVVFASFWGHLRQPVNAEISQLWTLFYEVHLPAFKAELAKHSPETAWSQEGVLRAADACIKTTYAIGHLTLQDLPAFIEKLYVDETAKNERRPEDQRYTVERRSRGNALSEQDSYQYRTLYRLLFAYRWARGAIGLNERGELAYGQLQQIPQQHVGLFFQPGTTQHGWRLLYNSYCMEIAEALRVGTTNEVENLYDRRHINWSSPDTNVKSFSLHLTRRQPNLKIRIRDV